MAISEIHFSTGELGLHPRGDNRLFLNWRGTPLEQSTSLSGYFRRVQRIEDVPLDDSFVIPEKRRDVFQGLATKTVIEELMQSANDFSVEAAFPVRDDIWYLYAARNQGARRQTLVPVNEMFARVRETMRISLSPIQTIQQVANEGYAFLHTIDPEDTQTQRQLLQLWEETFGWNKELIEQLVGTLNKQNPRQPTVWFSAIRGSTGELTAAAMAEMITFRGANGRKEHFVESTEWRSLQAGHIEAVTHSLHAQVLQQYPEAKIIAQCNFYRGAHRAAQKVRMVSPDIWINGKQILQILSQSVTVIDGNDRPGLRDFVVYILPDDALTKEEIHEIVSLTN